MIYKTSSFKFDDTKNLPFDSSMYSRMKFGSRKSSLRCAELVAASFIDFLKTTEITKPIVVAPSAYQEIPKSSFHIFKPFVNIVNRWLFENDRPTLITTRIRSNHVYNVDYGKLDLKDRQELIGKDRWGFNIQVLDNVHFVILDDLRMTGNLERVVLEQIKNSEINQNTDIHLLYFAENVGIGKIPDNFENELNHAAITNPFDFIQLMRNEKIDWNMRNIKYVLELEQIDFESFLNECSQFIPNFRSMFYDLVIQSNCITAPRYLNNISHLREIVNKYNL